MIKIKNQGFTNKTFFDEEKSLFVKMKNHDTFNHKSDEMLLNKLPFCPQVIENTEEKLVTKWIDGQILSADTVTDLQLQEIGKDLITLHNSKIKLASENQVARRFKVYREQIAKLGRKIPILDKYYKKINLFLKNIDTSAPVHNDLWLFNFIQAPDRIYITDWEYSSMGDVHFDLAYFIESSNLTKEKEKIFLDAYGDDYEEKYLLVHKILVNSLFVLWNNKHPKVVFDDTPYLKRVDKYMQEYKDKYSN